MTTEKQLWSIAKEMACATSMKGFQRHWSKEKLMEIYPYITNVELYLFLRGRI